MAEVVPKSRMRGPQRKALITAAALEIFAGKGYRATSLAEIGASAGVARTVLYDHFPSKKVLLLAVLQEQNAQLMEHVGARITGSGSPRERMRATVDAYFSFAEQRPAARKLLFDRSEDHDPEIRTVLEGIREARTRAVVALLAEDLRRLGIDPGSDVAESAVELVISGLDGMAQWWERHPQMPRATLVTIAVQLLWEGIGHA